MLRMDRVVPFTMKIIALDLDTGDLFVGYLDLGRVFLAVQDTPDF